MPERRLLVPLKVNVQQNELILAGFLVRGIGIDYHLLSYRHIVGL